MSNYKPYPAYKDSEGEWLGKVPEHWKVIPLKYNLKLVGDKASSREFAIALENIESWTGKFIQTNSDFEGDGIAFKIGDILFGKLRPYLAKVYLADSKGEAVGDFFVIRPTKKIYPRFAQYQILSEEFIKNIDGSTYGAKMPRVNWEFFGDMPFSTPDFDEQRIIATFLDCETARIDALTSKKSRFIELLREKRQVLITQAITRGLDPTVKMKDSGVEWLGEVPEHWEVKPLKHIARIVRGASPRPAGDPKYFASENIDRENTPWLTVAEITKDNNMYLEITSEYLTKQGTLQSQRFYLGTLVFTNSGATLGVPKILSIDCCANDGILAFLALSEKVNIKFLYYFLLTTTVRLRREMQKGGQPNLNTEIVKSIHFPKAPIAEQSVIVDFLDRQTTRIDSLISKTQHSINFLKERRAALITAAVTGQIDVRYNSPMNTPP